MPSYDFLKLYGTYQNLKIWYFGYHSCTHGHSVLAADGMRAARMALALLTLAACVHSRAGRPGRHTRRHNTATAAGGPGAEGPPVAATVFPNGES